MRVSVRHQLASLTLASAARIGDLGSRSFDDIVELSALCRRQLKLMRHALEGLLASYPQQMVAERNGTSGKADHSAGDQCNCEEKIIVSSRQSRLEILEMVESD